jgi:ribonuclease HI
MSNLLESFFGYAEGASRSLWNLSSAAWAIFDPSSELVSFRGVCIGRSTNNIAEYSALIELLSDAITHGIRRLCPKSNYLSHVPKGQAFGKAV